MDTNPDPTPGLGDHTDLFSDYLVEGAFDLHPEVDTNPSDCRFALMISGSAYYSSQAVDGPPAVRRDPVWDGIIGNEPSESTKYWECLQSPQSTPSRQSSGPCPSPTSLPPDPDAHVAMSIINSVLNNSSHIHAAREPPLPSCDHINCHPPGDVAVLSRRFKENEWWDRSRARAVSNLPYGRRGIYLLPVEILVMITKYFAVIDPFTSLGGRDPFSETWDRHRVFAVLAATCTHLRKVFYNQTWRTRVVTPKALPEMVELIKVTAYAHSIKTLITQLPNDCVGLLRDCLVALPSLHTLGIVDHADAITGKVQTTFKNKPDFPNIRKVAIPTGVHPILSRLPNVEELVCYHNFTKNGAAKSILSSLKKPGIEASNSEAEPVLKSLSIIGILPDGAFVDDLVMKHPKLRKFGLTRPTAENMAKLRGLKEIVELEIFIQEDIRYAPYNVEMIKPLAIGILQASECHKDCKCDRKCGCAMTSDCKECNPPKRFLRIKASIGETWAGPQRIIVDGEPRPQEIQVSPRRVLPTKII